MRRSIRPTRATDQRSAAGRASDHLWISRKVLVVDISSGVRSIDPSASRPILRERRPGNDRVGRGPGLLEAALSGGRLMRWPGVSRIAALLLATGWAGATRGADEPKTSPARPGTTITVWDTGRPSAGPMVPAALAGRNDWTVIPAGERPDSF